MLVGIACAVGITLLIAAGNLVLERLGSLNIGVTSTDLNSLVDARRQVGLFVSLLMGSSAKGMTTFFLFFLLRALLRRRSLAVAAYVLLVTASFALQQSHPLIVAAGVSIVGGLVMFILVRFGVLAMIELILVETTLTSFPLTQDFSTWYAGSTIFASATVLLLTVYAFHTAIAGRPLFKDGFLET